MNGNGEVSPTQGNSKKQHLEVLGGRGEEIRAETQDSKEPLAVLGGEGRGQVGIWPSLLPAPLSGKQHGTPALCCRERETEAGALGLHGAVIPKFLGDLVAVKKGRATHRSCRK